MGATLVLFMVKLKVKVKVKLSLLLTKHHAIRHIGGVEV
jgi:hypothetical protein